jgi:hypothetical protein
VRGCNPLHTLTHSLRTTASRCFHCHGICRRPKPEERYLDAEEDDGEGNEDDSSEDEHDSNEDDDEDNDEETIRTTKTMATTISSMPPVTTSLIMALTTATRTGA